LTVPFTFFDHTGDVGIDLEAAGLDELFREAALAFTATVSEPGDVRAAEDLAIRLESGELDLLLHDWLSELLFRFDTDGFLARAVAVQLRAVAAGWRLDAAVVGERGAGDRLPINVLVKAVTYHALDVRETPTGWKARVVLDI
jgi:SHS2 domain-containing protein